MKKIINLVKTNGMVVASAMGTTFFVVWMCSAYINKTAHDAERESRIEQIIAEGGTHHPSAEITVNGNYVAECEISR